jgi:drug/metabolite transporter (DMT)-like permease
MKAANSRGIFFMLLFTLVLPFNDAITKVLIVDYDASQILGIRFAFLALLLLPPALALPAPVLLKPANRGLLLVRGLLMAAASTFYVSSLFYLPLATTTAISMLFPLIVTAISPFALGERVGVIRYSMVGLGFVGALLVVQPTAAGLGVGELLALGAPLCFSAYIILTRRMSGQATQLGQLFWTCIGAFAVTGIMGWQVWQDPDNFAWGMIILTGLLAFVIYVLQIAALSQGEASVIVPFSYVSLATATAVGYMIWGELPNGLALAGIGLIAMSGIVIAVRS